MQNITFLTFILDESRSKAKLSKLCIWYQPFEEINSDSRRRNYCNISNFLVGKEEISKFLSGNQRFWLKSIYKQDVSFKYSLNATQARNSMAKELSTDRKESLNGGDYIKLVTLMLGLHGHVLLSLHPTGRGPSCLYLNLGNTLLVKQNVDVTC